MKHTKHILFSIICLSLLVSCGNNEPIIEPKIITEEAESNVEVLENSENTESTEVEQTGATSLDEIPAVTYNIYEGDLSYGTDEKILFFYSADNEESVKIDENLNAETELTTFSDIFRVDMEGNAALAEQYEISEANTFILIDEDGNMITKTIGASSSNDLLKLYD